MLPATSIRKVKVISEVKKKYKPEWERLPECQGWLTRALGDDPARARCKICRKEINAHLGEIKKHANSDNHRHFVRITQGGKIRIQGYHIGPKYTRQNLTYREEWEDEPECEGWLTKTTVGARCKACKFDLMPKLKELKKHGQSQRHLKAMTTYRVDKPGIRPNAGSTPTFQPWMLPNVKKRDFELRMSLFAGIEAQFRGAKEMCAILEEKHGVEGFSLTSKECSCQFQQILLPHIKQLLRDDMNNAPYSLVLDDPSNMVQPGQIGVCIYYFSKSQNKAVSSYLGLIRIEKNDIKTMVGSIVELLAEWELYGFNMISISTDGISSYGLSKEELMEGLASTCPNLKHMQASFCSVSQALDESIGHSLPPGLSFMLRESYNWFAHDKSRQVEHRELIESADLHVRPPELDEEEEESQIFCMKPIGPDSTQWLRIADFTTGFFMNYDALKSHFSNQKDFMAQVISKEFNECNRLYFTALQPVLTDISCLRVKEEKPQKPMENLDTDLIIAPPPPTTVIDETTKLCEKLKDFFSSLAAKIMTKERLDAKAINDLCHIDIDAELTEEEVNFGQNFDTVLKGSPLLPNDIEEVKANTSRLFRDLFKRMQCIFKDVFTVQSCTEFFFVPKFLDSPLESGHLVAPFFDQSEEVIKDVLTKYALMKMLDWKNCRDTLAFWQEVHNFGDATGNYPLRILSNGVWKMLCVPLFNDEVSKTLARINKIRNDNKFMDLQLLEEILVCKLGLKGMGRDTAQFHPPPELVR